MKYLFKLFKEIFPSLRSALLSMLVGISTGLMVFINEFQRHFFSRRYFGYTVLIVIAATVLVACIRRCFLDRRILSIKKNIRILVYLSSILFTAILFVNTQGSISTFLLLVAGYKFADTYTNRRNSRRAKECPTSAYRNRAGVCPLLQHGI